MDDVFALLTAVAVAFGPLSAGVTKLVDMVRNLIDSDGSMPKWTWNVVALVIAVVVCLGFQLDVVSALVAQVPALVNTDLSPVAGQLLTAVGVAGFASYWHERMDLASSRAKGKASN